MSLYEGAVKKPIMTSLSFLAIVIFGLFSLSRLPVDLYPDIETNTIMVLTAYPGASASDIETNVSRPLENSLNTVSNLKHITSRSSENLSLIQLQLACCFLPAALAVLLIQTPPMSLRRPMPLAPQTVQQPPKHLHRRSLLPPTVPGLPPCRSS